MTYHNRWIRLEQFRSLILAAWNGWLESDDTEAMRDCLEKRKVEP